MSFRDGPLNHLWVKLGVSLLLAFSFVWLLKAGALPILPAEGSLRNVSWEGVIAYIGLWCGINVLRAARWYWLLAAVNPISIRPVVAAGLTGYAAITLLPLRSGEIVRPVLIQKTTGVSAWVAAGSLGAERVIDGLFLSIVLFVSLSASTPLDPLPDRIGNLAVPVAFVKTAAYSALAMFAVVFLAMTVFYYRRDLAASWTRGLGLIIGKRAAEYMSAKVRDVAAGLSFLPHRRYSGPFILCTALYWFTNGLAMVVLARACGFEQFGFVEGCVMMGVLALGVLVPNAPGFFGAFQVAVYAGLALYFPVERIQDDGAVLVFLSYVIQVGTVLGLGAVGLIWHQRLAKASPAPGGENHKVG